jgi:hypothetical protein
MKRSSALSNTTLRGELSMQFDLHQDGTLAIFEAIDDLHWHGWFTRKNLAELSGKAGPNSCCVCSVPGLITATSSPVRALDLQKLILGGLFLSYLVHLVSS